MPDYRRAAMASAAKYGIDPAIFTRQIAQESGFNPNARSGAGALGIAQFMPATAQSYGVNPMDPMSALDGAARMDAENLKRYGSYERMLSAYNSGRPDAYKDPNFASGQTYNYVRSIMGGHTPATAAGIPTNAPGHQAVNQVANAAFGASSPARTRLIAGLLGNLNSFAQTGKAIGATDPQQFLSAALTQVVSARQAQQDAAQYGSDKTPVQLSSGHIMTGVNPKSPTDAKAVNLAESFIGTPYVWGGAKPGGFDCSGLLQYTWGKLGVNIPRTTYDQFRSGTPVGPSQLSPGDAVFFRGSDSKNGLPGHVGMYIGSGKFIEAPHSGSTVHISTLAGRTDYMGARRFA